jgi:putative ABC transport system permease protein
MRAVLRSLRRSPGFTVSAIAVLTLGIGATTAIFSIVNAVLFRPLAYPDSDRIVQLMITSFYGKVNMTSLSRVAIWREYTRAFDRMAVYDLGEESGSIRSEHVSADYFPLFGAQMEFGRPFSATEDRPAGPPVAVISDEFWRRRLGAGPDLRGGAVDIDSKRYDVIGVVRPGFAADPAPDPPVDVWLPLQADPYSFDHTARVRVAAHLAAGTTLTMAQRQLGFATGPFLQRFPGAAGPSEGATAVPLREVVIGDIRPALFILLGAVGFVLLIGCLNVANLSLARGVRRSREIATRAILGASRRHIIGPLLAESLTLSIVGGSLGLVFARLAVRALALLNLGLIPRLSEGVPLDAPVLLFALALAVSTGMVFGSLPAWQATRIDLSAACAEGNGYGGTAGVRQGRLLSALVAGEIALATVLLTGAGLLLHGYASMYRADRGFETHDVLTLELPAIIAAPGNAEDARRHLEAIPGVAAAAATWSIPLEPAIVLPFTVQGWERLRRYDGSAAWHGVGLHYLDVFRTRIGRGRNFVASDESGEPVAVINETMANQLWPGGNPLGQKILLGENLGPEFADRPRRIVGVASDARDSGLDRRPEPAVYVPLFQTPVLLSARNRRLHPLTWVVRTTREDREIRQVIERELQATAHGVTMGRVRSMDEVLAGSTARVRFNTVVISVFAGLALLLAALGIYGLAAYAAGQRIREIGIRIAVGAKVGDIRNLLLAEGLRRALVGIVSGSALALALTQWLESRLFGIESWDPRVSAGVVLLLASVSLAATYIPAHSAARVDPVVVLRLD